MLHLTPCPTWKSAFKNILFASGILSLVITPPFVSAAPKEAQDSQQNSRHTSVLHAFTPSWLDLKVEHRTRYETVNHSFKKGQAGSNQQVHQRTRLNFGILDILQPFELHFELVDFRAPVSDRGQGNSPTFVNHWDIFQLHLDLVTPNLLSTGQSSQLEVGRLVMDFGKGRLGCGSPIRKLHAQFRWITMVVWEA